MSRQRPNNDLRKEQITLLRHERKLKRAAADHAAGRKVNWGAIRFSAAAASAVAIGAAVKLSQPALAKYAAMNDAAAQQDGANMLVALADVATRAHAAFEAAAVSLNFGLLADGGRPKEQPPHEVVLSLLGLG
jgi:hypothetical protein